MKKIIIILIATIIVVMGIVLFLNIRNSENESIPEAESSMETPSNNNNDDNEGDINNMRINVSDGSNEVIYELNNSSASVDLYNQLPMEIEVEDYSTNEKIFYPKNELNVEDTSEASSGGRGVLAYYEPWGDVVMFYDNYSSASGLYVLGEATEGSNLIENLSGNIVIEKIEN